jgi:hypothetical protein
MKMNIQHKKLMPDELISILAYTIGLCLSVVLIITFIAAYFSGEMSVMVTINTYGEAYVEFVFLIICIPLLCKGFLINIRRISKEVAV